MDERVGGYRLERLVGCGGSGQVWVARADGPVPRVVAVKRLGASAGPDAASALRGEAALLAGLDHPGLVRVLDVVDDPPGVALVLPFLPGGSLRHLLDHRGALDAGEVVALLRPVADAVGSLHRSGWVHGDLKPENVLLTSDGHPVVADVGVAQALGTPRAGLTVAGTPAYLAPEVAGGAAPGARSDVYALGVVAYEALTGRLPHRGEPAEVLALAAGRVHRPLASWPSVPSALAEVVERALDPDPAGRPAGPVAFVDALHDVVDGAEVRLPPLAPCPPLLTADVAAGGATVRFGPAPATAPAPAGGTSGAGRSRWVAAGVAVLAVGVAAAAVLGAQRSHRAGPGAGSPGVGSRCPAAVAPAGPGRLLRADVDGDGCGDLLRWDGTELRVGTPDGTRTFRVGGPGDQLLLGDWDGDGTDSPALYRPGPGAVLYADRFPARVGEGVAASRVEPAPPAGRATVVRRDGAPDAVAVRGGR